MSNQLNTVLKSMTIAITIGIKNNIQYNQETMAETMHLNYQTAVDEYDEEMVNLSISLFLTETYNELKLKMPDAYKGKDYQGMKAIAHKFKTTSKYMGADDFAVLCGKMQKCVNEGNSSLNQIDDLYQTFMSKLEVLYNVCLKQNEIIQKTINEVDDENESDDEDNNDKLANEGKPNVNAYFSGRDSESSKRNSIAKTNTRKSDEFILKIESSDSIISKPLFTQRKSIYGNMLFDSQKKQDKTNQIQIRYSKAIQTFDAEIIDVIIQKFVTDEYKIIKTNLLTAFKKKDAKEILSQLHTMKLKAKYMCAEEFADHVLKIENCIKESKDDLKTLEALFPEFIENMELLYKEVQDCYEKNHQKEVNDSITPSTPSFNKEFLFKNKFFEPLTNGPEGNGNINNSPLTPKKPSSSSKYGLLSNNAMLREFDQFSNRNIMSSNKKRMFDIDLSILKTSDSDLNNTFDNDINALFPKFKEAIDNSQHKSLIDCLSKLKEIVTRYKFNVLNPFIDEWVQIIQSNKDFRMLNAFYDNICILLNQMKYIMKEKKDFFYSRTPVNLSSNKIINDSPSCSTVARNEDNILAEMKPLSINYFFSSSYSPEELGRQINEIMSYHVEEKKEKGAFMKHLIKPIKNNIASVDSNYPFKEEAYQCRIV